MCKLQIPTSLLVVLLAYGLISPGRNLAQTMPPHESESRPQRLPGRIRQHFVAPTGSPSGDGTRGRPWDLQTALSQPASVQPGDTIWVRQGVYGNGLSIFYSRLVGRATAPIIIRQYPGERATINGWLQIGCCDKDPHPDQGAFVWVWGLEFASSIVDRTGTPAGPPSYGSSVILDAIDTWAPGTKLINNIIHDTRTGISMWEEAVGAEAHGNIIYFNGFQASDRGHGHGFYVQNKTGQMEISNNIVFDQFDNGMQFYGTEAASVKNIAVQNNVSFNNGFISAGPQPGDNVIFSNSNGVSGVQLTGNHFYTPPQMNLGYNELGWASPNLDLVARKNYFIGGFQAVAIGNWQSVTFQENTVYSSEKYLMSLSSQNPTSSFKWDNNTYYGSGLFQFNGGGTFFGGWSAKSGVDANSTFRSGDPTGLWTFVLPNRYEPGRANIVVYNWDASPSVSVDVSSAIAPGVAYEIRDAQNFFGGALVTGTYDGKPVAIPFTGLTLSKPNGTIPTPPAHTAPRFGTFVLRVISEPTLARMRD
ncbi:MAG: right-handed parallel beta-helix repeat-containing protein [Candidatus Solibacter sp.]